MIVFGFLALFQILFLPGLVLLQFIKPKIRPVAYLMGIISSSMVLNYLLVFLLTVFQIYIRTVMISILALEVTFLVWSNWKKLDQSLEESFSKFKQWFVSTLEKVKLYFQSFSDSTNMAQVLRIAFVLLSVMFAYIALKWIVKLFLWNIGSILSSYDSIAVWNRWALDWASNMLPQSTWRYPQLLPANWSLTYMFIGTTSIHFFAKGIAPLFTLFIIVMFIDLGIAKKNPGFLIGAGATYLMLKKFLGPFVIEGLADMPNAFFAFTALYFLILTKSRKIGKINQQKIALLIVVAASGSAVTKQAGLLFLFLFLVLYILFYLKPLKKAGSDQFKKTILLSIIAIGIIVIPWYLFKQIQVWQGLEKSEVQMIFSATQRASGYQGFKEQYFRIFNKLGIYLYFLLSLIPLIFFVDPLFKAIIIFLIFPFFLSWSLFASYDFRNLSIIIPIFGLSIGDSFNVVFDFFLALIGKIRLNKLKLYVVLIVLFGILLALGLLLFPDSLLEEKHIEQVMQAFSPSINNKLVSVLKDEHDDFLILTNYPLDFLPGMEGKKIGVLFDEFEAYEFTIKSFDVDTLYLLIPTNSEQTIMNDVFSKLDSGEYELIFEDNNWIPYLFIKYKLR